MFTFAVLFPAEHGNFSVAEKHKENIHFSHHRILWQNMVIAEENWSLSKIDLPTNVN